MNRKKLLSAALGLAVIGLTGCDKLEGLDPGPAASARIMQQDKAQMALLLNKGFSTSVVAVNDGKAIEPCKVDLKSIKQDRMAAIKECFPEGHNPDGEVRFKQTVTYAVIGSNTCITLASGSHVYVFCDPPLDLDF